MVQYPDPEENDDLWPDDGYGLVVMDEFKPPDHEDFMVLLGTFEEPKEVVLPAEKTGYTYYIHADDGRSWSREQWHRFVLD